MGLCVSYIYTYIQDYVYIYTHTHMICMHIYIYIYGFPGGSDGKKKICLQCRRPGFNLWVRNIPWRRICTPTEENTL